MPGCMPHDAVCFAQAKASEGRLTVLETLAPGSFKTVSLFAWILIWDRGAAGLMRDIPMYLSEPALRFVPNGAADTWWYVNCRETWTRGSVFS